MRVVFAGTPTAALPSLRLLSQSMHELVGVVTRPDAPTGRGRKLTPSPVAELAAELGLPVLKPDHPRDLEFQAQLAALKPDICPVVAYGALLPQSALAIPAAGWVNLHFSLLPAWRGAAPVQRAIWAGDEVTGATTFRIVPELDAGPVFGVMTEVIRADDTADSLLARLADGGAKLLLDTVSGIETGALQAAAQPDDGITLAPKLQVADARLDWRQTGRQLDRQIRACWSTPGAWTTWQGERFKIGPGAALVEADAVGSDLTPGQLAVSKHSVLVGTGHGALRLGQVKPFGKKLMAAADWARGEPAAGGSSFE